MKEEEIDLLTKKIMSIVESEMFLTPQEVARILRRSVAYVYKHKERLGVLDLPGVRFSRTSIMNLVHSPLTKPVAQVLLSPRVVKKEKLPWQKSD